MLFNAPCLVRVGLRDEACRLLQKSLDMGAPPPLDWLLVDPDMQKLRSHRRFPGILRATREATTAVVRQLDRAKARGELPEYLCVQLEDLRRKIAEASG